MTTGAEPNGFKSPDTPPFLAGETVSLTPLPHPKAFIRKICGDDEGDRAYPHRDLPTGDNHLPLEDEPQGVNDRYSKKNCTGQSGKRILAHLSSPPTRMTEIPWTNCTPFVFGCGIDASRLGLRLLEGLGVFSISCIFRRIQRETTADCSAMPRTGGVRRGRERALLGISGLSQRIVAALGKLARPDT
jgi:hypothetical protein